MSNEITKELFQKAKRANSAEELKALAKENGVELTDEQAAEYFAKLKNNELTEEELNVVSGGVTLADEQDETKEQESPLQFI